MRPLRDRRGSILLPLMLFVSLAGVLLAVSLRPLLVERAAVARDELRLAAGELLAAGVEAARAAGATPDVRIAATALLDEPGLRGGFALQGKAHPDGAVVVVAASVESPALHCTQTRFVLLPGPDAAPRAASTGPFECLPRPR